MPAAASTPEIRRAIRTLVRTPNRSRFLGADAEFGFVILGGREHPRNAPASTWHEQTNWALNIVLEGAARFHPQAGGVVPVVPGWFYRRDAVSRARVTPDFAAGFAEFYLVIDPRTVASLRALHLLPRAEAGFIGTDLAMLEALAAFAEQCGNVTTAVRRNLMLELIALLRLMDERASAAALPSPNESAVQRAARILGERLEERFDGPAVAARVGLSYSTLRREFRRVFGVAPGDYRIRRRIEAATGMLTSARVKEVAERLGYSDAFAFSAQFKRFVGVSPQAFRRGLRGRSTPER